MGILNNIINSIVCSNGSDGKIALAFFGSLALCAPISGGHINPAVRMYII